MATAKYVLNIDPKVSNSDAQKTEAQLNSRFAKVAKNYGDEMQKQNNKITDNFGDKMKGAFSKMKVGLVALAGIVASVLTSPFDEVDAKINELLALADNTATRATQWGVDPARYLGLQQIGRIHGVNDSQIDNLLLRLADRLDMARSGEDDTLKNYLGEKDIIEVAHKLFRTWNTMSPMERGASMADILGARQGNVFAEMVQADWNSVLGQVHSGRASSDVNKRITKLADLEFEQALGREKLKTDELMRASGLISSSTIRSQNMVERVKMENMLSNIERYGALASTEATLQQAKGLLNDLKGAVYEGVNYLRDIAGGNGKEAQAKAIQQTKAVVATGTKKTVEQLSGAGNKTEADEKMEKIGLKGLW